MRFNHVANRLDARLFRHRHRHAAVENLGFVELRRTERSVWLRQPGTNVDLQFSRSDTANRDEDKRRSQVSFLSDTPRTALEALAALAHAHTTWTRRSAATRTGNSSWTCRQPSSIS